MSGNRALKNIFCIHSVRHQRQDKAVQLVIIPGQQFDKFRMPTRITFTGYLIHWVSSKTDYSSIVRENFPPPYSDAHPEIQT